LRTYHTLGSGAGKNNNGKKDEDGSHGKNECGYKLTPASEKPFIKICF
jgi:hypothetical protein